MQGTEVVFTNTGKQLVTKVGNW